jgi:predicted dehydrogenase
MSPIHIGIIGLSQGFWAANAHLPYLQSPNSKFKIVAVCNSSVEVLRRALVSQRLRQGKDVWKRARHAHDCFASTVLAVRQSEHI